jgi:hypothetical protein
MPGRICHQATAEGVRIVSDLRKVYVEATSVCDLACVTCIQRTWDEVPAHMPLERYQRLLDGLPGTGSDPITLTFGGLANAGPSRHRRDAPPARLGNLRIGSSPTRRG